MNSFSNDLVKISIVIPCYNAASFIGETIESCLRQSNQEFEIIIVDDGSTDDSVSIIKTFIASNKNIHLYRQRNQGSCIARNKGMELAKGEYLFFLDADDLLQPNALALLEANIGQFDACSGNALKMDEKGVLKIAPKKYSLEMPCLSIVVNAPFCGTTLIKKSSIKALWEQKFDYVDEFYFFAKNATLGVKFNKIEHQILYYRQHQTLTRKSITIHEKDWLESCLYAYIELSQIPLETVDHKYKNKIYARIFLSLLVMILKSEIGSRRELAYLLSNKIDLFTLIQSFLDPAINKLINIKLHLYYLYQYGIFKLSNIFKVTKFQT